MKEIKARHLKSLMQRSIGLMFKDHSGNIYFEAVLGIHTLFVNFPIDVVLLNDNNKVIRIREDLKPNKIYYWGLNKHFVLELPQGTVKQKGIGLGDRIKIIDTN